MNLENQSILFFSRSTQHGGTENVILQLCEILQPYVKKIVLVSAKGFEEDKLGAMGIKHYVVPDISTKKISIFYTVMKTLKKIIREENITVIHTHHRMAAFYVKLLGIHRQCIFINTSHNTFTDKRFFTRFAYSGANLIACGSVVKRNLQNVFGLKNVTVIHNAVKKFDGKVVAIDQLQNTRSKGCFLIGNIGRITKQKGMEFFIKAIPYVLSRNPSTHFFVIGNGEEERKIKEMCEGLPVTFLGYRTDIQNIMSQLDLVVLSSLWEGLPLTPIEAFSVGRTVVATAVDGTPEIVVDKVNGLLVQAKDIKGLADRINWLIEHPNERKQMELQAKKTYSEEFSFDKLAKSYLDYYKRL